MHLACGISHLIRAIFIFVFTLISCQIKLKSAKNSKGICRIYLISKISRRDMRHYIFVKGMLRKFAYTTMCFYSVQISFWVLCTSE